MNNRPMRDQQQQRDPLGDILQQPINVSISADAIRDNIKPPDTRNLSRDLLNSWINLLTHPTLATFQAQGQRTTWLVALTSVLVMGIIAGVVGAIRGILGNVLFGIFGIIPSLLLTPVLTLGGFFLVSIILYFVAYRLGGNGKFSTQTKLLGLLAPLFSLGLLISAPHNLIFSVLGGLVGAYVVFLMYQMVRATHNISERNAAIIVALPALLVLLGVLF